MLLKRLTLHGFKTFASRTTFEFHGGITAVIGPNGSGKSNLADGVRWVLGESSHATLRSKRTEDVIFAGSGGRAAMGMAEVSLTLDNSTGLLPIDFAEVTITRRAYRDGENQYLINGSRARLKDVLQVTAPLGGEYAVVGQGLVDAALALRPEERRGLFEHAAGITGLQLKRAEAERRLAAADANCQRLSDILSELTPRLRTLERQARQAGEAASVQEQLQAALRCYYGAQWRRLHSAVHVAEQQVDTSEAALQRQRERVASLEQQRTAQRSRLSQHRATLETLRGERTQLSRELAEAVKRAAVAAERVGALRRQREEEHARQQQHAKRRSTLAQQVDQAVAHLADLEAERQAAAVRLEEAGAAAREIEHAVQAVEAEADRLRREQLAATREIGALDAALGRLQERLQGIERELGEARRSATQRLHERERIAAEHAQVEQLAAATSAAREETQAQQAAVAGELAAVRERLTGERQRLRQVEHELTSAQARHEALARLRESGAGLAGGPRAVLAAERQGKLTGVLGAVASLVQVPADIETAIEVALGGHLQDIVVERWADAEAAITMLKRAGAGRATFQPLDTLRPPRPLAPQRGAGIVGTASELVTAAERYQVLVQSLLGRVLVVDDLAIARRVVAQGGGWTIVTLAGEITRPGGAVTGGAATREAGTLARERELRELPRRIAALEERRATLQAAIHAAEEQEATLHSQAQAAASRSQRLQHELEQQARTLQQLTQQQTALSRAEEEAQRRVSTLQEREQQTQAERQRHEAEHTAAQTRQQATEAALAQLRGDSALRDEDRAGAARALADARAAAVRVEERRRAAQARHAELLRERERLTGDEQATVKRVQSRERELASAEEEHRTATDMHHHLARAVAALEAQAAPVEAELAAETASADQHEAELARAAAALLEQETTAGRGRVALEHARGELAALTVRIEGDLPGVDPVSLEGEEAPAPRLETTIATLREKLRRIGLVDPAVIEEHASARERHTFMTRELADIEAAARALRDTIDELDALMRERFATTFEAVNAAFSRTFSRLFNGGSARLILTDDSSTPGVDIVAHPPGKRPQSLALLSGGERALTAVALLFAILEVNPTPFCLLDEVDAALDESNVARFRDLLANLAAETQFIVVTHNRGTIEGADTLYGISMRQDGVSQVISLRLEPEAHDDDRAAGRAAD